jgi:hypothetical protein
LKGSQLRFGDAWELVRVKGRLQRGSGGKERVGRAGDEVAVVMRIREEPKGVGSLLRMVYEFFEREVEEIGAEDVEGVLLDDEVDLHNVGDTMLMRKSGSSLL